MQIGWVNLSQEAAGFGELHVPIAHAASGAGERQMFACTGHRHVEEPALFLQSARIVPVRLSREEILFQSHHAHGLELQSLG